MKNELKTGIYSNGTEIFRIDLAKDDREMEFFAITDIEYLPIKEGERTVLPINFIQSLIDDDELGFLLSDE